MACGGLPFPGTDWPVRTLPIFNEYEMSNVWVTVTVIVHLSMTSPLTEFLHKKRIRLVSMDLLIIFTHYTKDNQQECFRLSN